MAIDPTTGLEQVTSPAAVPATNLSTYTAPTYTPGSTFNFDPNQYLPGIQQTAASIYNPQQAQIDALQKLQTSQTEQARVKTQEDFAKEMTAKIESINQRGAFFGGGAINQQGDVSKRQTYALNDINTQDQAAQAGFLAQKAGLNAAQAEYVQNKLSGAQGSAYSMWKDSYDMYTQQEQAKQSQANADREYELELKRIKNDEKASKASKKAAEKALKAKKATDDADRQLEYAKLNKPKEASAGKQNYSVVTEKDPITGASTTKYIYN